MKCIAYFFVGFFLFARPAFATDIVFGQQSFSNKRCAGLQSAMMATLSQLIKVGRVRFIKPSLNTKLQNPASQYWKKELQSFNKMASDMKAKVFTFMGCTSRNNILDFSLSSRATIHPSQYTQSSPKRFSWTSQVNLGLDRERNAAKLMRNVSMHFKAYIGMKILNREIFKKPPKQHNGKGYPPHLTMIGQSLEHVQGIAIAAFPKTSPKCNSFHRLARAALKDRLGSRLVTLSKPQANTSSKRTDIVRLGELMREAYEKRAQALLLIGCVDSLSTSQVDYSWIGVSQKLPRVVTTHGYNSQEVNWVNPQMLNALLIIRWIKHALHMGGMFQFLPSNASNEQAQEAALAKKYKKTMPHVQLTQSQYNTLLNRQIRKQQKRVAKKGKKAPSTKSRQATRELFSHGNIDWHIGISGMFFSAVRNSVLGCAHGGILYKPIRIGVSGTFCIGKGLSSRGFDMFWEASLDVMLFELKPAWNMHVYISMGFGKLTGEIEEYPSKGFVPFYSAAGMQTKLRIDFHPLKLFRFGIIAGWMPLALYEVRFNPDRVSPQTFYAAIYAAL